MKRDVAVDEEAMKMGGLSIGIDKISAGKERKGESGVRTYRSVWLATSGGRGSGSVSHGMTMELFRKTVEGGQSQLVGVFKVQIAKSCTENRRAGAKAGR